MSEHNKAKHGDIPVMEIENLVVHYETDEGVVEAVNNVSLAIHAGETVGLVGETGAGKTTIALSMMQLLPTPPSRIIQGDVRLRGESLLKKSKRQLQKLRGSRMSMIFQDPMTALNPVQRVGDQIAEVLRIHQNLSRKDAMLEACKMLNIVGIPSERYGDYPHQFSGGMKQRVVIAIALACRPELIIADEPTTALDVTIQAQVLELMKNLRKEFNIAMLLITHDFGVVADICDRCVVIYAGEVVESGSVAQIFDSPCHPYTIGLFDSLPSLDKDVERLKPIPGLMIDPMKLPGGHCSFYERCEKRGEACGRGEPPFVEVQSGHFVRCGHAAGEEKSE